jgi:hypothetical protein
MFSLDLLKEYWALVVGLIGLIVWAVRVEGGMKQNASDIRGLWKQRHEDNEAHRRSRDETNATLARIDSKMDAAFGEFRTDIKLLLQRDTK